MKQLLQDFIFFLEIFDESLFQALPIGGALSHKINLILHKTKETFLSLSLRKKRVLIYHSAAHCLLVSEVPPHQSAGQ